MKKKCRKPVIGMCFISASFFLAHSVQAGIFKCVDTLGTTVYIDKPCPETHKEIQMKAVKDPIDGYIAPTTFVEKKQAPENAFVIVGKSGEQSRRSNAIDEQFRDSQKVSEEGDSGNFTGAGVNTNDSIQYPLPDIH